LGCDAQHPPGGSPAPRGSACFVGWVRGVGGRCRGKHPPGRSPTPRGRVRGEGMRYKMKRQSDRRAVVCWALWGLLAATFLTAGPVRAQMTEDQFLNAVMPVLTKVDAGSGGTVSATWLAPEFWTFQLAADKKTAVSEALIGRKLIAQALIFV